MADAVSEQLVTVANQLKESVTLGCRVAHVDARVVREDLRHLLADHVVSTHYAYVTE
jgi:hypothetical protein